MSRFFDTLKEAGRLREPGADQRPAGAVQDGASAPEWLKAVEPVMQAGGNGHNAVAPLAEETRAEGREAAIPKDGIEAAEELLAAPAPRGDLPGRLVTVTLDSKARLLPHIPDPKVLEHYRRLRTKLLQQHATKPFRTLMVSSPSPQDGKTLTVLNLALSFALLSSFKVLVVDGDLRKGSLAKWLGLNNLPGLSNAIDGSAELNDIVLRSDELPLHVVTRGTSKTPPGDLLNSPKLGTTMRRLAEHYNIVLIDSPPANLLSDTQLLAESCEAILLVARVFSTTCKALEKTARELAAFRILGTVLNGVTTTNLYPRYDNYY